MHLQGSDYTVDVVYGVLLLFLAQWFSREKKGHEKNTQDYFLAGRAGVAMVSHRRLAKCIGTRNRSVDRAPCSCITHI
jgi:hypothetical protein